jgi:hypothetical protein
VEVGRGVLRVSVPASEEVELLLCSACWFGGVGDERQSVACQLKGVSG